MSTLKNLVGEVVNIENELKTCHTDLFNILKDKGVEVDLSVDKISNLIDKVSSLKNQVIIAGDDNVYATSTSESSINSTSYNLLLNFSLRSIDDIPIKVDSIRFSAKLSAHMGDMSYNRSSYLRFDVVDGSDVVLSKEYILSIPKNTTPSLLCVLDIPKPKSSYTIKIYGKTTRTYSSRCSKMNDINLKGSVGLI